MIFLIIVSFFIKILIMIKTIIISFYLKIILIFKYQILLNLNLKISFY